MGNRAVIRFKDQDVGIYLHWNGGRDSVEAFLEYCRLKEYRSDDYGIARLTTVIGNFFGGGLSVGLISTRGRSNDDLDPGDNGVYIVDNWEIVARYDAPTFEQNEYDRKAFLVDIDESMPEKDRLGKEYLVAEEVPTSDIKVGDVVYDVDWNGAVKSGEVVGFGGSALVNGSDVYGVPYAQFYDTVSCCLKANINNYLRKPSYRVRRKEQEDEK